MRETLIAIGVGLLVFALLSLMFMVGVSWAHGKTWPLGRPIRKRKTRSQK